MPINAAAHSALHQQIEEARFWDDNVGALFPVSTQQQRQDLIGLGRHGRSKEQLHMLVDGHILHNLRAVYQRLPESRAHLQQRRPDSTATLAHPTTAIPSCWG